MAGWNKKFSIISIWGLGWNIYLHTHILCGFFLYFGTINRNQKCIHYFFFGSMCFGKWKISECGLSIKYGACNQTLFYFLSNKVDIREMWCIDDLFSAGLGLFCFLISISCKSFWERFLVEKKYKLTMKNVICII